MTFSFLFRCQSLCASEACVIMPLLFHRGRRSVTLLIIAIVGLCLALFIVPRVVGSANREGVIVLTGFEPFGSHRINSSWEVIRRFEGKHINGRRVVTVRLPVSWGDSWLPLKTAIDQYQPRLIISVGQGATGRLELAHSARNILGNIPDNAGIRPDSTLITVDGPDHYDTRLDLPAISKRLANAGITAEVSPHAGDYVCNFISYRSYEYLARAYPNMATFFVHVPAVLTADQPADQKQLNDLTDALQLIIDSASQQVMG